MPLANSGQGGAGGSLKIAGGPPMLRQQRRARSCVTLGVGSNSEGKGLELCEAPRTEGLSSRLEAAVVQRRSFCPLQIAGGEVQGAA